MRVFKTKWFARYASREGIEDLSLVEVVREIESGLVDVDYGGGLLKKRIARSGGGKSGGYRSIIAYKSETRCVFIYCFTKSDKENLDRNEVSEYKEAASVFLGLTIEEIVSALENRKLEEVKYSDKKIQKQCTCSTS